VSAGDDRDVVVRAFAFAVDRHGDQTRKGTTIPYVSHVLAVAALVLEDGGSWEDAAAALLHDTLEDTATTPDELRDAFGPYVARIVEGCSDRLSRADTTPWRERKVAYLTRLPDESEEVLRVSVADKLHNSRSIVDDLRTGGVATLDRFNGGREGTLWYYETLADLFRSIPACTSRWVAELERVVSELKGLAGT
jgi:(p)ppGpp synthase/HD superfamily hydrolase